MIVRREPVDLTFEGYSCLELRYHSLLCNTFHLGDSPWVKNTVISVKSAYNVRNPFLAENLIYLYDIPLNVVRHRMQGRAFDEDR